MVDSQSILTVLQDLLELHAREDIAIHFIDAEHAVLWAKDNTFPTDALSFNTHTLEWSGHPDIVSLIENLETQGYSITLMPRDLSDVTGHNSPQKVDYKLVVRG